MSEASRLDSAAATIAWFADIGLPDRPRVGGKGASLGELERAGIPVPPGFVITTAAFRSFIDGLAGHVRDELLALESGADDPEPARTAELRARIAAAPLPDELAASIDEAHARLRGADSADIPVAVRSSATSEDSAAASFAGLQDTYLWVRGASDVGVKLRGCWASLYSDAAISYRRRMRIRDHDMAMGVVVQRMVDARCAGVMFTRSPLSGDRSVVAISASWGLGSTVVGGEVTPDEFVMNKITGQLVRSTISCKELRHVPNAAGSGVREEPVPADLQRAATLGPDELRDLCEIARRIEKHYGAPQDIEWALDAQRTAFILQSRPETVWSARERDAALAQPKESAFGHVLSFFGTPKK
jgi:pyruvate,water dikinase